MDRFDLIYEPTLQRMGNSHKYIKESGPKSMTCCVKDLDRIWTKKQSQPRNNCNPAAVSGSAIQSSMPQVHMKFVRYHLGSWKTLEVVCGGGKPFYIFIYIVCCRSILIAKLELGLRMSSDIIYLHRINMAEFSVI